MSDGVLLLAVNDFPPMLGGEATLYHGLARHLPAREAVILAPCAGDAARAIDAALPIGVLRRWIPPHRGLPSRVARAAFSFVHLAGLLLGRPIRYIVAGQLLSLGVPVRALARLFRIPYAIVVHGADLADFHDRLPWGLLARWVVRGAETVLVNSRFTAALVDRLLPGAARRILVLPIGVDPTPAPAPLLVEALRLRYRLADGPVLLSVARLIPMKGHDVVIENLPILARRFPGVRYLVVGAGPDRDRLERRAAARGITERVVFAGSVPPEELAAHYALGTLFVQLSRDEGGRSGVEGFGISFLEAAAHGLPSIAGRSGGVADALRDGETGFMIEPRDGPAFLDRATRLLGDGDLRARVSQAARRWAASRSWDAAVRCLLSLAPPPDKVSSVTSRAAK